MLRRLLAAALMLVGTVVLAGPAAAAPCTVNCYQYWADVSITQAWTTALNTPVVAGTMHSYTARVTNTGWRTGGLTGPVQWPGPASGTVYVGFEPGIPYGEKPWGGHLDICSPRCGFTVGYNGGLACDTGSIPTNTTWQLTVYFFAPETPGTYTFRIWLYPFPSPDPWVDYNPNNNETFLSFEVG